MFDFTYEPENRTGSGSYAHVYKGTTPGTVVKRGVNASRDCWLYWAGYCLSHPSPYPWMPRIHAVHVDFRSNTFLAVMEELTRIDHVSRTGFMHLMDYHDIDGVDFGTELEQVMWDITGRREDQKPFWFDGHRHNWMCRPSDNQVVLTDPFHCSDYCDGLEDARSFAPHTNGRMTFSCNFGTLAIRHCGDEEPDPDFDLSDCIWLPVYRYEHGGVAFNTTGFHCPGDSGQTGYIYVSRSDVRKEYGVKRIAPKLRSKIELILKAEVEIFSQWANGEEPDPDFDLSDCIEEIFE